MLFKGSIILIAIFHQLVQQFNAKPNNGHEDVW